MNNLVTLVPVGLQWRAYSQRRLIAQHAIRTECERRAVFLGWQVNNPTFPALAPDVAKREQRAGLAVLARLERGPIVPDIVFQHLDETTA